MVEPRRSVQHSGRPLSMAREINPNMPPNGGYVFVDHDGTRLKGTGWADLERRVREYRESRQVPVGDVHREVMDQACARNLHLCRDASQTPPPIRPPSLKGKVFQWLGLKSREQRAGAGLDFVAESEADGRTVICRACSLRAEVGAGCSACESSLAALRKSVLGGRRILDSKLGACVVLEEDLVCSTQISEAPRDSHALPSNCWRKKK